ncbi:MAG TPA: nucleoside 2-deoxyribosyltransferase [Anaerolineales bacterium]|nr:nucleoside 2-deoxyribosyltransferase [Anaerolineales bacterium]
MKVYFSCSLTGGRNDEAIYGALVDHLQAAGHEVLTAHLARPEVMRAERVVDPGEVYHRDIAWIEECRVLVAEVSTPSHGVGYEIAYALERGKPVLCLYRRDARVSKMITGNDSRTLRVVAYASADEALALVDKFLAGAG